MNTAPKKATTTLTLGRYAPDAKALVVGAQALADSRGHLEVLPLHLLANCIEQVPGVTEVLRAAGADVIELQASVSRALLSLARGNEPAYLAQSLLDLLARAERETASSGTERVEVEPILNALSQEIRGAAGELLGAHGIGPGSLRPHLAVLRSRGSRDKGAEPKPATVAVPESARDLVDAARRGVLDPILGNQTQLRRLLTILERRAKCHPLLVGEPGVGKGALVAGLAHRIAQGDVPASLVDLRVLEIELGTLTAGIRLRSELDDRLRGLVESLGRQAAQVLLVVRGLDQWMGNNTAGTSLGDLFRQAARRHSVRWLGTTTPEGRRKIASREPELERWFTVLEVEEPSVPEAIEILRAVAQRYESHHRVTIEEGAIGTAVRLAKRYLQDRFLPESAMDLLDESAAARRVETEGLTPEQDAQVARFEATRLQLRSLEAATDPESLAVRQRLAEEAEALRPDVERVRERRESFRGRIAALRALRTELALAEAERDAAASRGDSGRAAEVERQIVESLRERIAKAEAGADPAEAEGSIPVLRAEHVAATLACWTGIPVNKMMEGEADKLLRMEERLAQRVKGQDQALGAVARAVRRGRVGLRDGRRPIGSFLFLGPSGVGKTELAKALAQFLFDDEQALTRLDMSEFMERHMAARLVGAPFGYADSEQGGFLTEAVRRRPYSVLLFDEVEKAHSDVFDLLLQVLDDGRLTDGRGRLADFSNTVVILTSNIGSQRILDTPLPAFETDQGREQLRDGLLEELRRFFRPELLNRIDETVVFSPLSRAVLGQIAELELKSLTARVAERGLRLEVTPGLLDQLVTEAYEPALGARPLRRTISKKLQDPLAEMLLKGPSGGSRTVRASLDDRGGIVWSTGGDPPATTDSEQPMG